LGSFRQVPTKLLTSAMDVVSAAKIANAVISPLQAYIPFDQPSLFQPSQQSSPPLQSQPQLQPNQQQFTSGTHSGPPETRLPFCLSASPLPISSPPASPPPAYPLLLPGSPPSQRPQSSTTSASPLATHPVIVGVDLETLAHDFASPRHKPIASSYTMKPRPRLLEPIWRK